MAAESPAAAEEVLLAAGLRNPFLALREAPQFLNLPFGARVLEQLAAASPDEAMSIASGASTSALALREAMLAGSPESRLLADLAQDSALDSPTRRRVAVLAGPIVRHELSLEAAVKLARSTPRYFAQLVDRRATASGDESVAIDRALEAESLTLCRGAQESLARALAGDLSQFRAIDLYLLLAYGRAEAGGAVFPAVFDRLLRLRGTGDRLVYAITRLYDWKLRDFAAAALDARRFDAFLSIAGPAPLSRLVRNIDQSADPLHDAVELAELIAGTGNVELLRQMAAIVPAEYARCAASGDKQGELLYGLIAARLVQSHAEAAGLLEIGGPYVAALASSDTLNAAALFDAANRCTQRYFFWDDDDGVESFANFRAAYAHDPAWTYEDHGVYAHLTGRGADGRMIEIFANVPIDVRKPANRGRENEAQIRQQAIADALQARGLTATVLVHRGHSFHVQKTLGYVTGSAVLVILGSCGGVTQIHKVIELSHGAEVIATKGVGATEINDVLLKNLNGRLLVTGPSLAWSDFWREQQAKFGRSALFQSYLAPNQDAASVLLRAYYAHSDAQ